MHVAAIDAKLYGIVIWDSLASFNFLLETENYTWPKEVGKEIYLPDSAGKTIAVSIQSLCV